MPNWTCGQQTQQTVIAPTKGQKQQSTGNKQQDAERPDDNATRDNNSATWQPPGSRSNDLGGCEMWLIGANRTAD